MKLLMSFFVGYLLTTLIFWLADYTLFDMAYYIVSTIVSIVIRFISMFRNDEPFSDFFYLIDFDGHSSGSSGGGDWGSFD